MEAGLVDYSMALEDAEEARSLASVTSRSHSIAVPIANVRT